jgi:hypothetical protein
MTSEETLKKLKVLAERGIGGERDAAANLLTKICEKQGIVVADLGTDETIAMHKVAYKSRDKWVRKLLQQCVYKVVGAKADLHFYIRGREQALYFYCTDAQAVEIELDYEFYSHHLREHMSAAYSAFLARNSIYPVDCPISNKPADPAVCALARVMDRHTRAPMIKDGDAEDD